MRPPPPPMQPQSHRCSWALPLQPSCLHLGLVGAAHRTRCCHGCQSVSRTLAVLAGQPSLMQYSWDTGSCLDCTRLAPWAGSLCACFPSMLVPRPCVAGFCGVQTLGQSAGKPGAEYRLLQDSKGGQGV